MAYDNHEVVKPKLIADTGVELLTAKTEVLDLFTRENPDYFFGSEGDTVSVRVPGTLPARTYGWRNDRSEPIRTDVYQETKVDITVGADNLYSAVKLTDEQKQYDLDGSFGRLTDAQTTAVGDEANRKAARRVRSLPFEVGLAVKTDKAAIKEAMDIGQDVYFNAFVDAGKALNQMRVPFSERVALVGAEVAANMRKSQKLTLHQGTGNEQAFSSAIIGNYAGFTVIEDPLVKHNEALIVSSTGIVFWNAAPAVPQGATYGATSSQNGLAMRWLVDYDHGYQVDRSTWSTWAGFRHVEDKLVQINEDETQMVVGNERYFVRGAKIIFGDGTGGWVPGDGSSNGPDGRKGADPASELAKVYNDEPFGGTLPKGKRYPQTEAANPDVFDGADDGSGGETGE